LNINIYPWQTEVWTRLLPWRIDAPHAILLHGTAGIGKVDFAKRLAAFWLCETEGVSEPCGECPSCRFVALDHHPDLLLIRPEAVALAEGMAGDEEPDGEMVSPEPADDDKSGKRAASHEIRIGQIQSLIHSTVIGSHRGGRRVIVIYPAEAMNTFTANALLKLLEEPPGPNHLILVTDAPQRLLATVLSRCQQVALPPADAPSALNWLKTQGLNDVSGWLAEAGGAPLLAWRAAGADDAVLEARRVLLQGLARGAGVDAMALAERLTRIERAVVVGWLQRWTWDLLGYRLAARIRYYPKEESAIAALARSLDPLRVARYARTLSGLRRAADHPLNARLFFEDLLLRYARSVGRV
jgi:DNA polymerase-3 subunit delta'